MIHTDERRMTERLRPMADYSFPPDPGRAALEREAARQRELEEWRVGFRTTSRSVRVGGIVPRYEQDQCLGCGCLVGDRDVHRQKCPWAPRVPVTTYVEEGDPGA